MTFLKMLEGLRGPLQDKLMLALTYMGDEVALFIIVAFVFWCVNKKWGYRLMTVCFAALTATSLLKGIFAIPRPWVRDPELTPVGGAKGTAEDYSFPSGHTTTGAAAYGAIASDRTRRWLRVLCVALMLIVGFTRMYLGVHTPQDVAVGLVIGLASSLGLGMVLRRREDDASFMHKVDGVLCIAAVVLVAYVSLRPSDAASESYRVSLLGESCSLLGAAFGILFGRMIEQRYVKFETKASIPAQVLKLTLGLAAVMVLRLVLKKLNAILMPGFIYEKALRYFALLLFVTSVWPLTFRSLNRFAAKE